MQKLLPINLAALIAAIGYGITFPLLAIRLEKLGVSGTLIGFHSAMPALGWIIGSALSPWLQARFGLKSLLLGFLFAGAAALAGLAFSADYLTSTFLRFFFGGGVGLFFRGIEYWINNLSADDERGRSLSIYSVMFMLGMVIGSLVQPMLGSSGLMAFAPSIVLLVLAGILLLLWPRLQTPANMAQRARFSLAYLAAVPAAFIGILAYGLYEDIPAYLTSVYAIKNGLGEDIAAYTLAAAALGNILLSIPIGLWSDRVGRLIPLMLCAVSAAVVAASVPFSLGNPILFLALLVVLGGTAGAIYCLALAMIGDHYQGSSLVVANATFGIVYAAGGLMGPIFNGAALDTLNTHGLMASCCAIFATLALSVTVLELMSRRTHDA